MKNVEVFLVTGRYSVQLWKNTLRGKPNMRVPHTLENLAAFIGVSDNRRLLQKVSSII